MTNIEIRFTVSDWLVSFGEAVNAVFDKSVEVSMLYTFSRRPLKLSAPASYGDRASLIIRPHRIELRVNDVLCDEEWPCGELAVPLTPTETDSYTIREIEPERPAELPDVLRHGITTSEIRLPGVNIGDCIPFSDPSEKRYHLFYLYDRHHHGSKWGLGAHQWAHVSTTDLVTWDEHPMAIAVTEPWEGSICTGSIVRTGDLYFAWYAVRMSDGSPARMTSATSRDNLHYTKSGSYFTLPSAYEPSSARDPKVVELDGLFHMFVTTTRMESGHGCLAHLTSETADFAAPTDCGAILEWESGDQPECPDWFKLGDYYYLIYSIGGAARYLYSREPFSGFIRPSDDHIPCGRVPKAAFLGDRCIFTGFVTDHGYADDVIFAEATQNEDGTLRFTSLPVA